MTIGIELNHVVRNINRQMLKYYSKDIDPSLDIEEIDDKGRLNLSRRQVLIDVDGLVPENDIDAERAARPRRPHNDRRGGFNRNNRK